MAEGVLQSSPEGTPQGGPLSPLLANILLDDLDKELERRGLPFVRYADDFMIFTKTRRAAERVFCAGEADETVREPRPVDSAASADVLLETLAVRPHAGPESLGTRRSTPTGLPPRKESQRPVAHGQNHCQRGRDDERLAARSGTGVAEITLGQACSAPSNRVVQTRMLRGVGGGRSDPPAYPIRPIASQTLELLPWAPQSARRTCPDTGSPRPTRQQRGQGLRKRLPRPERGGTPFGAQAMRERLHCGRRSQIVLTSAWLRLYETLDFEFFSPDSMRLISMYFGKASRAIREPDLGYPLELSPTKAAVQLAEPKPHAH